MRILLKTTFLLTALVLTSCEYGAKTEIEGAVDLPLTPYVVVLGIAQDAGYPQANCKKDCCAEAWENPQERRHASCIALVDPRNGKRWLFEATPNMKLQLKQLDHFSEPHASVVDGIFLTHAHIGHYIGLIHLGREVIGGSGVPVYAMPRMRSFLRENGPWSQLVKLKNIELKKLNADSSAVLESDLSITPIQVPHRDEFSETVGFIIRGSEKSVLFLPDIDKWEKWNRPIEDVLAMVDVAYLDATFYANGEIPGRDMALIPHPFVEESMARFVNLPDTEKRKIRFIHMNHTNPMLQPESEARKAVLNAGYGIAEEGEIVEL
ncbi:MAG: MBL fold metallo-hydrolase [Calditrichota bacterium]